MQPKRKQALIKVFYVPKNPYYDNEKAVLFNECLNLIWIKGVTQNQAKYLYTEMSLVELETFPTS